MLECRELATFYDAAQILFDVSLRVERGAAACLLGRNGVGKSTCLRSIMGLARPAGGSVHFDGKEIAGLPAFRIAQLGIGYVPEDRRIFPDLSVEDNLLIAERSNPDGIRWSLERAYQTFPPLREFRKRQGGFLSGGQQQMLTIARTLMGCPSLLLVDEPTEGLSPLVVRALEEAILELKRDGMTMLLAAQDMRFARRLADRVYVMDKGRVVYDGTRQTADRDEAKIRSFLTV